MFEASATNQLDIMKMLIDAGADVNLICGTGPYDTYPALSRAKTKEAIELLILNGAKVNMVYGDEDGTSTVLGERVENNSISPECVLTLLKAGAASIAQTSYTELIDYYLQKHSEADEKILAQIRTLWEKNNVEKREELEEEFECNRRRNMDDDWEDDEDWDFDNDSEDETEDEDDSDEENEEDESKSIFELVKKFAPNVEEIKAAIAEGADVNAKDRDGNTPLIDAIGDVDCSYLGEIEVIKALLESGADVHAKGEYGTALDVAKRIMQDDPDTTTEAEEIIALLRQYGAK